MPTILHTIAILFLGLGIWGISLPATGQTPSFQHYSTLNGLSSNEVYQTVQDSKGFLWFCTDQGLSQYDGYKFRHYSTEDGLTGNTLFEGHEDYLGRIWFCTLSGGICYYDEGQFFPHPLNDKIQKLSEGGYTGYLRSNLDTLFFVYKLKPSLLEDSLKVLDRTLAYHYTIWGRDSLYTVDLKAATRVIKTSNRFYTYENQFIPIGASDWLYIGVSHHNKPIDHDYNHPDSIMPNWGNGRMYVQSTPTGLETIHKNEALLYTKTKIRHLKNKRLTFQLTLPIIDSNLAIMDVCQTSTQDIWVGTNQGLFCYRKGKKIKHKPLFFFANEFITHVLEDKEGNIWVATLKEGVKMLSNLDIYQYTSSTQMGFTQLANSPIGLIGISTKGALHRLHQGILEPLLGKEHFFPITTMIIDHNHLISGNGFTLDLQTKKWNKFIEKKMPSKAIYQWKPNCTLFGTHNALKIQEEKQIAYTSFDHRVNAIYADAKDSTQVWLGTPLGLVHFHIPSNTYRLCASEQPLLRQRILDIAGNSKGTLFLATKGGGLVIKQGKKIYQISKRNGLLSAFIECVYVENDSIIWVGSQQGLNKIIWNEKSAHPVDKIMAYTVSNGLPSNIVKDIVVIDKQVYLASNKGIISMNTAIDFPQYDIPIYATKIEINGQAIDYQEHYNLDYQQRNIAIQFAGISFQNTQNIIYKYQLKGKDNDWHIGTTRNIQYLDLPPSRYEFVARAKTKEGVWSTNKLSIIFEIKPHFTQTPIFWSLVIGIILLFTLGGGAWYIHAVNRRKDMEKLQLESEQRALRSQMNPHFIFNAMNSILYFILKNDKESASQYLSDFASLIRAILKHSKKEFIPLQDELESIQIYLDLEEQRLEGTGYYHNFQIDIDNSVRIKQWQIPPMLIQPLVENAIRHGLENKKGDRSLKISLFLEGENLLISVKDNGIGLEAAKKIQQARKRTATHESTGLENTKTRLKILSYWYKKHFNLSVEVLGTRPQTEENGMIYTLHIPCIKE